MNTALHPFQKLNSPIQFIDEIDGVELWIKREDLIHKEVSGNKWRKLKYYLEDFNHSGKTEILTFGGAFSNHLAATATIGNLLGIKTRAIVRGDEVVTNETLEFCRKQRMELNFISREDYRKRDDEVFINSIKSQYPDSYIIPEGGKGVLGIQGCTEILKEVESDFDVICCSAGTGTTFTGLMLSGYEANYEIYPALKGGGFLKGEVLGYLKLYHTQFSTIEDGKKNENPDLLIQEDYHFGGYGKIKPQLIRFMNQFYEDYQTPLDPVYTGKMMFGIVDRIKQGCYKKGVKILAIHTGGLQGIKGMNKRLEKNGNQLNYNA